MDTQITTPSRTHFRPTTASQRDLLFRTVAETGNVSHAAGVAHVGRGTYYYWRPRFAEGGYPALAQERSRAPYTFRIPPIAPAIIEEVKAAKRANPKAGYRTIANEIRKAHQWQPVIGPTKVREILIEADLVAPPSQPTPKAEVPQTCHAPQPLQTLNIDLCLVPLTHEADQPLVSVSVAAAAKREIPDDPPPSPTPKEWPGQVFQTEETTYDQKMTAYVQKRAAKGLRKHRRRQKQAQRAVLKAETQELRCQRRRQRWARCEADQAWRDYRKTRQVQNQAWKALSRAEKRRIRAERQAQDQEWRVRREARRAEVQARAQEDEDWHQGRQAIRQQEAQLDQMKPLVTVWLAILVILDNCTRVSLKLPVFTAGAHVTAEMVVAALAGVLPPELKYLISDNGPQFTAQVFAALAAQASFIHVRIAPHRACTNGIAERFVRTLKEWLEGRAWNSVEELIKLLEEFQAFYNDRPHQGAELNGLSPNEYARRLLDTCSTC